MVMGTDRTRQLNLTVIFLLLFFSSSASGQSVNRAGGHLAYIHNNGTWIKALPSGEPIQALATPATDPQWCASGSWLAVRKTKAVNGPSAGTGFVVVSADGHRQFSIATDNVAWSPTRDELAFKDLGGISIDRFDSAGIHTRSIMRQPNVRGFAWSSDGRRLAVAVSNVNRSEHLWTVNADGTYAHELTLRTSGQTQTDSPQYDLGEITFAGWTGDDKWILLWPNAGHSQSIAADGMRLIAIPSLGGVVRQVSDLLPDHDVLFYRDYIAFARHKDSVVITDGGNRESWTNKRVTIVNPTTANASVLTDAKFAASSVDWSPNGASIVSSLGPDIGGVGGGEQAKNGLAQRHIWTMDTNGGHVRQITSDPAYRDEYPRWSRNGHLILFVRMDRQNNVSVWTAMQPRGTLQKVVDVIADPVDKDLWFSFYGHIPWAYYLGWTR